MARQWLCNAFATAMQWLCNSYAMTMQGLGKGYAKALQWNHKLPLQKTARKTTAHCKHPFEQI
jgi:hypothetical protein